MRKANYHTHTVRCKHAEGTEREYIEAAIDAGMEALGFSDHVPFPYENFQSPIRMGMEELSEYAETLRKLREEYQGKIDIKIGFEMEYLPKYFEKMQTEFEKYKIDYLILGQHFVDEELVKNYVSRTKENAELLERYVDAALEAFGTGAFAYMAHPDLPKFTGDGQIYRTQMRRLCEGAKRWKVPLEINLAGVYEGKHYPNGMFWEIAAEVGNEAVIGYDAHFPKMLGQEMLYEEVVKWAKSLGVNVRTDFRI